MTYIDIGAHRAYLTLDQMKELRDTLDSKIRATEPLRTCQNCEHWSEGAIPARGYCYVHQMTTKANETCDRFTRHRNTGEQDEATS